MRNPPLDAVAAPRARFMARFDAVGTNSLASVRTIAGIVWAVTNKVPIRRNRFTCAQFSNFPIVRKPFSSGNSAPGVDRLLWEWKGEFGKYNSSLASLLRVSFGYFLSASIDVQHV